MAVSLVGKTTAYGSKSVTFDYTSSPGAALVVAAAIDSGVEISDDGANHWVRVASTADTDATSQRLVGLYVCLDAEAVTQVTVDAAGSVSVVLSEWSGVDRLGEHEAGYKSSASVSVPNDGVGVGAASWYASSPGGPYVASAPWSDLDVLDAKQGATALVTAYSGAVEGGPKWDGSPSSGNIGYVSLVLLPPKGSDKPETSERKSGFKPAASKKRKAWRFIAANLRGDGTEEFLTYDIPLSDGTVTNKLSGPDEISGKLTPEIASMKDDKGNPLFVPWSTSIIAEKDGVIRADCIVDDLKESGPDLSLECVGFAGYPKDIPYKSNKSEIQVDPTDMFRHIWSHIQGYRGGNLGVVVDSTTSKVKIGTEEDDDADSDEGEENGPYKLNWWDNHDLQDDLDKLASDTPFDYREEHKWNKGEQLDTGAAHQVAELDIDPSRVMQSFVRDPGNGDWYVTQVKTPEGKGNDDTTIFRCDKNGNLLSSSVLKGAGHGSSLGFESDGGDVYLWLHWASAHTLARWKYEGDVEVSWSDSSVESMPFWDNAVWVSIDQDHDRIATRHKEGDSTTGAEHFWLRRLSDVKDGKDHVLAELEKKHLGWGAWQGFATDKKYLYTVWGGTAAGPTPYFVRFEWETGKRELVDLSGYVPSGYASGHNEVEGVAVSGGHIYVGKATGATHHREARIWELAFPQDVKGKVSHRLRLGVPKIGKRRQDLRFVAGENVTELPEIDYEGDQYASGVVVLGAGEGRKMVRGQASHNTGRLRRVAVVEDKSIKKQKDADKLAEKELKLRTGKPDISELVVTDHKHAPIGSIHLGDEIAYRTEKGWHPSLTIWVRVLEIEYTTDSADVKLTVKRGDKVDND